MKVFQRNLVNTDEPSGRGKFVILKGLVEKEIDCMSFVSIQSKVAVIRCLITRWSY